jgi:sugar phosphate isomerase/epimerase
MEMSLTISSPGPRSAPILFAGEFPEQIDRAAVIGFKAVELHIRDPKMVDHRSMLRALEKTGIAVSTIGTGRAYGEDKIFFTSPDNSVREAAVKRIKDQIDFALSVGAKVIIGLIRGPLPEGEAERAKARTYATDCFKECSDWAAKAKVQLAVEAINRYETNFLTTAEETDRWIREVDSETTGLHLDTFHMNIEEVSIEEAIRNHAKRLIHIHLADSNRWAPGMGHLNFESILRTLKETGYQGYLGLECLPVPNPQEAAEHSFHYLQKLLSRIEGKY